MDVNDSGYSTAFVEYKVKVLWINDSRKSKTWYLDEVSFFSDMEPLDP